jgi:hypothetical protein
MACRKIDLSIIFRLIKMIDATFENQIVALGKSFDSSP